MPKNNVKHAFDPVLFVKCDNHTFLFDGETVIGRHDSNEDSDELLADLKLQGRIASIKHGFNQPQRRCASLPLVLRGKLTDEKITKLLGYLGYFTHEKPLFESLVSGDFTHAKINGDYHPILVSDDFTYESNSSGNNEAPYNISNLLSIACPDSRGELSGRYDFDFVSMILSTKLSENKWCMINDHATIDIEFF